MELQLRAQGSGQGGGLGGPGPGIWGQGLEFAGSWVPCSIGQAPDNAQDLSKGVGILPAGD